MESNPTNPVTWTTPAGRLLQQLAESLPVQPARQITVFGSAVLQMYLEPTFLSRDVDIIGDEEIERAAGLLRLVDERLDLAFQVCDRLTFRSALGWEDRAHREVRHGHTFVFPHPWDISSESSGGSKKRISKRIGW